VLVQQLQPLCGVGCSALHIALRQAQLGLLLAHGGAMGVGAGQCVQARDGGFDGHARGLGAQRVGRGQRCIKGGFGLAGGGVHVGQLAPQPRRFNHVVGPRCGVCGLAQVRRGTFGLAGREPVTAQGGGGHAGAVFQLQRHFGMQVAGNGCGHRSQGGFVDQVVGKGLVAQHARGFQFGPGAGQGQGVGLQHMGGQPGVELGAGHGRASGQRQRGR